MSAAAIVIGGGVNELVAAHYLARAGHRVLVLGEAAADDAAPEAGWIPPGIVRDLALERHGLTVARPDPWAVAALPDGGRLELSCDLARSADAIRILSTRDAEKWPEFCRRMHALAGVLGSLYSQPAPDPLAQTVSDFAQLARVALRARGLGRAGIEDLLRLLPMSIADLLDDWFENDALKGLLGAAGVMHLCQGPRSGGTAFNFLHHHVGSPMGVFRQPLTNVTRVLRGLPGVETRSGKVGRIGVKQARVSGVELAGGEEIAASVVISGAHPQRTLLELLDPAWLDPQLVRAVQQIRSRGVVAEVTLTLDRDPGFKTLAIAPSLDYLERAYDHAKYGRISTEPYLEARHAEPDSAGHHRVQIHVQYAPHTLKNAVWDTAQCDKLARGIVSRLSVQVPGLADAVIEQRILTPRDLEQIHGCPQGQKYQAEIALDQALWMRPTPGLARYSTPIGGLYLCGLAMHPGGGIAGAAGAHAAHVILRDLRKGKNH